MLWLLFAFVSAALLGCYDAFKKEALRHHRVMSVLFLNTLFCSLIFLPVAFRPDVPFGGWDVQKYIVLKSFIVLSSWICGYYGMKNLPLTLVGPINATRPVMVLLGALFIFGERLNLYQWIGVLLAIISFFMLSRAGKKEGINFRHNRWIALTVLGAVLGALSGLYDKFLMASPENGGVGLNRLTVQSYYNFYQCLTMGILLLIIRHDNKPVAKSSSSLWGWLAIPLISIFLSLADLAYFYSLSLDGAMVSIVSMVRRASVVVSFILGGIFFHEKNLRTKAFDVALVLLGMFFLYLGTK